MNLFIYTASPDRRQACATSLADLAALITALSEPSTAENQATLDRIITSIAQLVLGDREPLTLTFCTDAGGTLPAWAGVEDYTVQAFLGVLSGGWGSDNYAETSAFAWISPNYTGVISLESSGLQAWLRGHPHGGTLTLQLRLLNPAGAAQTLAVQPIRVLGAVPLTQ